MNRLKEHYLDIVKPDLLSQYKYDNISNIPKLEKIILNYGLQEAALDPKLLVPALLALELITSQKSYITKSKKVEIQLKIRKGMLIGCKVTLRNTQMYHFLDLLLTQNLPKIQQFEGLKKKKFIHKKNVSFHIKDNFIFPLIEANFEYFQQLPPLNIIIQTTSLTEKETESLLRGLQFPIK
jgi:large subunit ribosomal protein L5